MSGAVLRRAGPALAALVAVAAAPAARAQYAPYQQRVFEQARRDGERQIAAYLDQAYQPNPRFSSTTPQFDAYLRSLAAQAEQERRERAERKARAFQDELVREALRQQLAAREAAERQAELDRWADAKRRGQAGDAGAAWAVARTLLKGHPLLPKGEVTGLAGARPWLELASRNGSGGAAWRLASLLVEAAPAGRAPRAALDMYRRAVELGELDAVPAAAELARTGGEGFAGSWEEARRLCEAGVARRHPAALREAAFLLLLKPAPSRDDVRQAAAWLEAASPADTLATAQLARMLWRGAGVAEDKARAVTLAREALAKAPRLRDLDALLGEAHLYGSGGARQDPAAALSHMRRAAEAGSPLAASALALWYSTGQFGIKRAAEEERRWRERAARGGVASDAVSLAREALRGAAPDAARAAEMYGLAAEAGDAAARCERARLLARGGPGLVPDPAEARRQARLAAEGGFPPGMLLLAELEGDGAGGPRDARSAFEWTRRAAEAGDPGGMAQLAALYLGGGPVPASLVEARRWAERSARAGSPAGRRLHEELGAAGTDVSLEGLRIGPAPTPAPTPRAASRSVYDSLKLER